MKYKVPIDAPDTEPEFFAHMKTLYPDIPQADLQTAWVTHANKDLTSRIVETMNVYGEELVKTMQEQFAQMVQAKVKEQEKAIVTGIMEGLGLDPNPVAKLNDVEAIVRKTLLEFSDAERKSGLGKGGASPKGDEDGDTEETKGAPFNFSKRFAEDSRGGMVV
jgi:hypothetical protein